MIHPDGIELRLLHTGQDQESWFSIRTGAAQFSCRQHLESSFWLILSIEPDLTP